MTPEQLAYWLQGFAELHPQAPTQAQWQLIREHVASVFDKETPALRGDLPRPTAPNRLAEIRRILEQPLPEDALRPIYRDRGGRRGRLIC